MGCSRMNARLASPFDVRAVSSQAEFAAPPISLSESTVKVGNSAQTKVGLLLLSVVPIRYQSRLNHSVGF